MTDLEMTKLCAEAMGLRGILADKLGCSYYATSTNDERDRLYWNPLLNDAQAMALVKRFKLCCGYESDLPPAWWCEAAAPYISIRDAKDLNRAIVECISRMVTARTPVTTE